MGQSVLIAVIKREIDRMLSRRIYFVAWIVLPLFSLFFMGKIFGCDGGHRGRACRGEHCSPAEPRRGNPFTGKHRHIRPSSGPAGLPSPSEEGWEILPQQICHAL